MQALAFSASHFYSKHTLPLGTAPSFPTTHLKKLAGLGLPLLGQLLLPQERWLSHVLGDLQASQHTQGGLL